MLCSPRPLSAGPAPSALGVRSARGRSALGVSWVGSGGAPFSAPPQGKAPPRDPPPRVTSLARRAPRLLSEAAIVRRVAPGSLGTLVPLVFFPRAGVSFQPGEGRGLRLAHTSGPSGAGHHEQTQGAAGDSERRNHRHAHGFVPGRALPAFFFPCHTGTLPPAPQPGGRGRPPAGGRLPRGALV